MLGWSRGAGSSQNAQRSHLADESGSDTETSELGTINLTHVCPDLHSRSLPSHGSCQSAQVSAFAGDTVSVRAASTQNIQESQDLDSGGVQLSACGRDSRCSSSVHIASSEVVAMVLMHQTKHACEAASTCPMRPSHAHEGSLPTKTKEDCAQIHDGTYAGRPSAALCRSGQDIGEQQGVTARRDLATSSRDDHDHVPAMRPQTAGEGPRTEEDSESRWEEAEAEVAHLSWSAAHQSPEDAAHVKATARAALEVT
jgi:hypothetical protein